MKFIIVKSVKRLIPCIFIHNGKAVKWFDNQEVLSDDVVALAKQYNDNGADELIVFDLSNTDEEHDAAIDLMKNKVDLTKISSLCGYKNYSSFYRNFQKFFGVKPTERESQIHELVNKRDYIKLKEITNKKTDSN